MARRIDETIKKESFDYHTNGLKVIVVDHGSPSPEVAAVRDHLANQVRDELESEYASSATVTVVAASMERRPGEKYAFADPLLESVLQENIEGCGTGDVIVAMAFLSPGRHAGPGGDVADIIEEASKSI